MKTSPRSARLPRALRLLVVVVLIACSATFTFTSAQAANKAIIQPFAQTYDKVVYGDFTIVGNGNMRCPSTPSPAPTPQPSCAGGAARTNNALNDFYDMRYADVDSDAATFNSSTSGVTIPTGATVDYARLNWAGDTGHVTLSNGTPYAPGCSINASVLDDPAVPPPGTPGAQALRVTVGAGGTQAVSPQTLVTEPTPPANQPQYYSASADVAAMFAGAPTGSPIQVTVGNIWTPTGLNCFAGWSLTVVYKFPGPDPTYAPTPREVFVYGGHIRQDSVDPTTTLPISGFHYAGGPVKVGNTAYEGDWGISGDQMLVNGAAVAEPSTGDPTNFFISDVQGEIAPNPLNNYSVDAKSAILPDGTIPAGATSLQLGLKTSGDSYLDQELAISVPVPQLTTTKEVCQTTSPTDCGPGGSGAWAKAATIPSGATAYWRITVTNPSALDIPNATLSDEAEPSCVSTAGSFTVPAGQSVQFYCSTANLTAAMTNTSSVMFVPPGAPEGTPPLESAPASAKADVYGLSVLKETCQSLTAADCGMNGAGPWASTATIPSGSTAYWRITLTDTGSVPVSAVTLNDPGESSCTVATRRTVRGRDGSSQVLYCATTNVTATKTNTATASYTPPNSPPGTPRQTTPPSSATVMVSDLAVTKDVCQISDAVACAAGGSGPWTKATTIASGATAYWRITVANAGETDLAGITLNDDAESSCVSAAGSFDLAVGASKEFFCSTANVTAASKNTVTASYRPSTAPPESPPVTTPPDSAAVDVYGLTVLKETCSSLNAADCGADAAGPWVSSATIPSGSTAFWRVTVTNTGSVPIDSITLDDPKEGSCVAAAGGFTLAAGATTHFGCSTAAVTAGITNSVTASYHTPGTPPDSPPTVTPPSAATVAVSALTVAKEVCQSQSTSDCGPGGSAEWAATATIPSGSTAYWRITVTNTGEVDLTGVTLTDEVEQSCASAAGSFDLAAGGSESFYCSTADIKTATTNTVTARYLPPGAPPNTSPVVTAPATASASVFGLALSKEVCQSPVADDCLPGGSGPWAKTATIPSGTAAYWRITVTNTGEVDLDGITVQDDAEPSCVDTAGHFPLVSGGSDQVYCSTPDVRAAMTNTATASYTPPGGSPTVTPPSSASVDVSDLLVVKEVCQAQPQSGQARFVPDCIEPGSGSWSKSAVVPLGGTAYWRITVTNTGRVDLTGITVADNEEQSCANTDGFDLKVGESKQILCSTANLTSEMTNAARASYAPPGAPPGTPPVTTPEDSATVDTSGLVVLKEVCQSSAASDCDAGGQGPWSSSASMPTGSTAFWRITATNIGSADLTGVTLADDVEPSCTSAAGAFDVLGDSSTQFYCSTANVVTGMTNTVTAYFTPPGGSPAVTPPSSASVEVFGLQVLKEVCQPSSVDRQHTGQPGCGSWSKHAVMPVGESALWRITVTNTGSVGLTGITVADVAEQSCARTEGFDLAAGESKQILCSTANLTAAMTNTVTASYVPPGAPPGAPPVVTPEDSATVDTSGMVVLKEVCRSLSASDCGAGGAGPWAASAVVPSGSTAFWRITATNAGSATLSGITLADEAEPSCTSAAGSFDLVAGGSTQFYCSTAHVVTGMTNTVTGSYTPPGSPPVTTEPAAAAARVSNISVVKEVCQSRREADCGVDGAGPWGTTATLPTGFTAHWRITVTNTGEVDLPGVTLQDALEPTCAEGPAFDLAVGVSHRVYCSTPNMQSGTTNTATAVYLVPGSPPGTPQTVTPPATATAGVSDLLVAKDVCLSRTAADCGAGGQGPWGKSTVLEPGATAFWRVTVTNDSDVDVAFAILNDPAETSCALAAGHFGVIAGASLQFFCSTSNVTTGMTNTVWALYERPGTPPPPLVATPPSSASVQVPYLAVSKSVCQSTTAADCGPKGAGPWGEQQSLLAGDTAFWRITIANTGDVDLTAVTVQDAVEPSCVSAAGSFALAAGKHLDIYCSTANVTADLTNSALAAFVPPGSPPGTAPVLTKPDTAGVRVQPNQPGPEPAPNPPRTGQLAWTGVPLLQLLAGGVALMVVGAGLLGARRRRR